MIKKNLHDLPLWAVVAHNIYSLQGQLLVAKGTVLKPTMVEKLMASGFSEVCIESEEPESPSSGKEGNSKFDGAFLVGQVIVSDIIESVRSGRPIDCNDLKEAVNIFYPAVINSTNVFNQLLMLRNKDEYTVQHSIAVGAFSVKICQLLGLPEKVAKLVGTAGVMHDIGKVKIPDEVLNKPRALDNDEWEQMRKHPQYGYEILKSAGGVELEVQLAVLQHHERLDRRGYPLSLPPNTIHIFSRILAISDAFDAMTSERVYRKPLSIFRASEELMADAFSGRLDPQIVIRFVNYILDMSPGQQVLLSTGEIADVILPNKAEPARPLVQTGDKYINLEKNREIWIEGFVKN
ncbi:MAG: HD-GYP domain-containing protein [Bacillota bacterium]